MALVFCSMVRPGRVTYLDESSLLTRADSSVIQALPCLTHPDLILRLCVKPDALPETKRGKDLARVLMVCFGSQAMLSGIAIRCVLFTNLTWQPVRAEGVVMP